MGSLREIKDRMTSVRGTLKITSAMKLVASSKLRKAQSAVEALRPYEETLCGILRTLMATVAARRADGSSADGRLTSFGPTVPLRSTVPPLTLPRVARAPGAAPSPDWRDSAPCTVVVAVSSNSSLCGAFNSNVIKRTLAYVNGCEGPVAVVTVGRKIAEAVRRAGIAVAADYSEMAAHPSYDLARRLSDSLVESYFCGQLGSVVLIYNHFVSTSHQDVVCETYLPFDLSSVGGADSAFGEDYIVEPSPEEAVSVLMPRVMSLKMYAAVLDSQAAEHAARTIAMQTATDNATELLADLTLEYNKGRQQKITAEILDLVGGRQD